MIPSDMDEQTLRPMLLLHIKYNVTDMPESIQQQVTNRFVDYWRGFSDISSLVDMCCAESMSVFQSMFFAFITEEDNNLLLNLSSGV